MFMSYCRMENTKLALDDCVNAIEEEGFESLSETEKSAAMSMYELCKDFVERMEADTDSPIERED